MNAFLYRTTGDASYLERMVPTLYDDARILYDDEGDRYHGYGRWVSAVDAVWLQEVPYFLQALKNANLRVERGNRRMIYPGRPTDLMPDPESAAWYYASRGWSDGSAIVLASAEVGRPLNVSVDVLKHLGDPQGQLFVIGPPAPPIYTPAAHPPNPGQVLCAVLSYHSGTTYPLQCVVENPSTDLYRIETRENKSHAYAPFTDAPEAAVLRRQHAGGQAQFVGLERQLFYMRPIAPHGTSITLKLRGDGSPVYFRIEDEHGATVAEDNFFRHGSRADAVITLPIPSGSSPTWRLYTTTRIGPFFELIDGAEELLLAVKRQDLDTISGRIAAAAAAPVPAEQ